MVKDVHGDSVPNQFGCDVRLQIREAENEVQLPRENIVDFRA